MNKLVLGVLGSAILLGAIVVSNKQWKTIENQAASIEKQQQEITYLTNNLDLQVKENLAIEEENFMLEEHSGILRDSVMRMQKKMTGLRKKITKQERYISLIEKKLNQLNTEYQSVKSKLASIANKDNGKNAEIDALLRTQSRLKAEIESLRIKKKWAQEQEAAPSAKINKSINREVTPYKKENLSFALPGTQVKMLDCQLRKKRFSKSLKKVKKGTDWRYTILNINMEHPHLAHLLNKSFKLKLMDMEKQEVLSYVESNPNFPNSKLDSKGIGFSFEGKPLELVYYNNDDKSGENYEIRFYHIDDSGNEHLIPGATYQIVKDGKVL